MGCDFDYSSVGAPSESRLKAGPFTKPESEKPESGLGAILKSEPFPKSERWNLLEKYLRNDILPFLDEQFPAVQVMGSHLKGFATERSDVDFKLYCHGPTMEGARKKFVYLQRRMRRAKWRPCAWNAHIDDHHIVDIRGIRAGELAPSCWIPWRLYGFIGRHDLVWVTDPTRRCMELADLFARGMIAHPSMEGYTLGVIDDLLQNPRAREVWKAADLLYRGQTSRINRSRIGISRSDQRSIERARYEKFGLPAIEDIFWWRYCNKDDD